MGGPRNGMVRSRMTPLKQRAGCPGFGRHRILPEIMKNARVSRVDCGPFPWGSEPIEAGSRGCPLWS
ncbi:hypothetical protein RB298 [Rhodopirellula baltica SH 1]|uniref:Uncharacterized protein n=1 Tax=Rhodopirellula baltica (strain DSM 10527 / NCIMB 13988 / SH1) TaxID=243090 RepID=Q7UYZ2_RHOBA|nr:hypothetical protein RB298 [Rhodopirellula baltica SH 1]